MCSLCKISATSSKVLQRHYEGRKHKMRVERDGKTFDCELCQITANSQKQLDNHLKSKIFLNGSFTKIKNLILGSRHKYNQEKKDLGEHAKLNGNKGVWIILLGMVCIFVNFLILFKMCV